MGWRTDPKKGAPAHLSPNPIIDPKIHHWDHVGIAVRDPRRAIELFRDVFGAQFVFGGDNMQIGIRSMVFKLPTKVKVELLSPLYDDSYLAKYLDEHGEGFHHATIFVDDIKAMIADLEAKGFETVDTKLDDSHWVGNLLAPEIGVRLSHPSRAERYRLVRAPPSVHPGGSSRRRVALVGHTGMAHLRPPGRVHRRARHPLPEKMIPA